MQKIGDIPGTLANDQGEFDEADPNTGTPGTGVDAAWLNTVQRELVNAVKVLGGEPDPSNDHQLADGLARATPFHLPKDVVGVSAANAMPYYPEILMPYYRLQVDDLGDGRIQIPNQQSFVWRGVWQVNTDDYPIKARTFTTAVDNTYHLRWNVKSGFYLANVGDPDYNTYQLPEGDPFLDSTLDDMLIARIISAADTPLQITTLTNRHRNRLFWYSYARSRAYTATATAPLFDTTVNVASLHIHWARVPRLAISGFSGWNMGNNHRTAGDSNQNSFGARATRYCVDRYDVTRDSTDITGWAYVLFN